MAAAFVPSHHGSRNIHRSNFRLEASRIMHRLSSSRAPIRYNMMRRMTSIPNDLVDLEVWLAFHVYGIVA